MRVPFIDLSALHEEMQPELNAAYQRVMKSGNYILGPEVESFERAFALFCHSRHCVSVGNGLDALRTSLLSLDIGPGDEVIVPSDTFISTWNAVSQVGAIPVPVDVDGSTYNMLPGNVRRAVSDRTRAIITVDLYGQPAEADELNRIASDHGLKVIQDAAQSSGASYRNRVVGSYSDVTCFSFYPTKNLGAMGDGGAMTTNDDAVALKARMIRNNGSSEKYVHESIGYNSRLDELQAAFLASKLPHLQEWNGRRAEIARRYGKAIGADKVAARRIVLPAVPEHIVPSWHLYVVQVRNRDEVRRKLAERGIACLVHYPIPPHLQEAYSHLGYARGSFPVAEGLAEKALSLPMYPQLSDEAVDYVVRQLSKALAD